MKGRKDEAEVIVRLDQQEQKIHICVASWPAMYRKMRKLYGESLDGNNPPHSARWIMPLNAVTFRSLGSINRVRRMPSFGFKPTTAMGSENSSAAVAG